MRKEFAAWIESIGRREQRLVFLTGDLGFMALENVQAALGPRFVNMGVCEQNMVLVAAGLAHEGLLPVCYSIAPFAVFRPYEQIRLDVALHNQPVKIVGNGGGYGYGIMGATHHALEDVAVLSVLPNFRCFVPVTGGDVAGAGEALFRHSGPGYLRLGYGNWPREMDPLPPFASLRTLQRGDELRLTIAALGPVLLNLLPWIKDFSQVDLFAVSELPCRIADTELAESVARTGRLWTIEEHARRGGLGEFLCAALAREGIGCQLYQSNAAGYPTGKYGSQAFHRRQSELETDLLRRRLENILQLAA